MSEVEGLLTWINGFGLPRVATLEEFVLSGTYWKALCVIGPEYASMDVAVVPEAPHSSATVHGLGQLFCAAVNLMDERELHLPSQELLKIDFGCLAAWVDSGEPTLGIDARFQAEKCLKVCLAAAVKCNDKAKFIPQMKALPTNVMQTLMRCIQNELLKEPVQSQGDVTAQLRARVAALERDKADADTLRERNEQLLHTVELLERELAAHKGTPAANAGSLLDSTDAEALKMEQATLRNQLRAVQDELITRDAEARAAAAAAAEATARVRDARELRDQLDLAKERIAGLTSELAEQQQRNSVTDGAATKELSALREELRLVKSENNALRDKEAATRKDNAAARAEAARLKLELEAAQQLAQSRAEEKEKLDRLYVQSRSTVGTLSAELDAAKLQLKEQQTQRALSAEGGGGNGSATAGESSLLDEMAAPPAPDSDALAALSAERDALKRRLEDLEADFQAEAEAEREQFRQVLKQATDASEKHKQDALHAVRELDLVKAAEASAKRDLDAWRAQASNAAQSGQQQPQDAELARLKMELAQRSAEMDALKQAHASLQQQQEHGADAAALQAQVDDLTRERDRLKELLKVARDKLMGGAAATPASSTTTTTTTVPDSSDLERKAVAAHLHRKGLELMRLTHQLEVLRKERSESNAVQKHNGLLNHLRAAIDPFQIV